MRNVLHLLPARISTYMRDLWPPTRLLAAAHAHFGTTSQLGSGQKRFPEPRAQRAPAPTKKGPSLLDLNQRPTAGDHWGPPTGGLGAGGGGGEPVVGSPTHPVPGHAKRQTWLCSGKRVRLAAGGERVVITRWWEPPPGAGPCADPRGNSPAVWLAGGGQGRAATSGNLSLITPQELQACCRPLTSVGLVAGAMSSARLSLSRFLLNLLLATP
jgi:hypothetical protein